MKHLVLISVWLLLVLFPAQAQLDILLQIEEPTGETLFSETISLTGLSRGLKTDVTFGGGTASTARAQPFNLSLRSTDLEPLAPLASKLASGNEVDIIVEIVRPTHSSNDSLRIERYIFRDSLFSDISIEAELGAGSPEIEITFDYSEIDWELTFLNVIGEAARVDRLIYNRVLNTSSLNISLVEDDRDFDGLPDTWEIDNNLNPDSSADAFLDLDNDGFNNLMEFRAGTDPRNFTSRLRVTNTNLETGGTEVRVEWTSTPGRQYILQSATTNLDESSWMNIGTIDAAANASVTSMLVPAEIAASAVLYRVRLVNP